MTSDSYLTGGGIRVHRTVEPIPMANAIEPVVDALDARRGVLLASSYEYPGRYTRWDMGFVDPLLALVARGRRLRAEALNPRGLVLLPAIAQALQGLDQIEDFERTDDAVAVTARAHSAGFAEEDRSRQPSVFSLLRALIALFRHPEEPHLGLYGAFGYDLAFQFEPIRARLPRPADQRDLVLYLPDELLIVDHRREVAQRRRYDFEVGGRATAGLPRAAAASRPFAGAATVPRTGDHAPGAYAAVVRVAREAFKRGDLFEVVPGQTFFEPCPSPPSELFRRLRERNPAPYGFLMNLGDAEYLVGASPEMYVRVDGDRVETCPISGTIARGHDAIADAAQIQALLNSAKDESELTMCTDVDRNDKSRICVPGTVRVIGRRQIEMYARLIHTVDHVEGRLRPGFDALDAFLAHTWAVTVTGAPKAWAMQFLEDHERSPRAWYGGAVGLLGFDGNLNTGLTLRTIRVKDGAAEVRAGATLLYDSDPDAEEEERRRGPARAPGGPPGFLRPHARELSSPDRRRGHHAAGRVPGERARRAAPRPGGALARPGHPERFRSVRHVEGAARARNPHVRGLPGAAGPGRAPGRRARSPRLSDARQGLAHPGPGWAAVRRSPGRVHRGPLPFPLRDPREAPVRAGGDRGE